MKPEPGGGAHTDFDAAAALLGASIEAALDELESVPGDDLRRLRRAKFRAIGMVKEPTPA